KASVRLQDGRAPFELPCGLAQVAPPQTPAPAASEAPPVAAPAASSALLLIGSDAATRQILARTFELTEAPARARAALVHGSWQDPEPRRAAVEHAGRLATFFLPRADMRVEDRVDAYRRGVRAVLAPTAAGEELLAFLAANLGDAARGNHFSRLS